MSFEVFQGKVSAKALAAQLSATIYKSGQTAITMAAFAEMGSPATVELLWDRDRRVIGMRPAPADSLYAVPARRGVNTGSVMVGTIAFMRHYGIDVSESRRYPVHFDGSVLCIDVSKPGTAVTRGGRIVLDPGNPAVTCDDEPVNGDAA